ncbi:hypothetical protein PA0350 [Candidatus Phytoplasma australiense]|uniref:Uncharacterized protein n=1 Tax=Phytoplasma australiense TaxID=59748 RepID=B1V9R3_PHYAS|nr:hypothetical protein PA0350 [Candidatus Phytoplasma australiense]
MVYNDGSFFKISETGKIQQVYWRFRFGLDSDYKLLFYDENEHLIKSIETYIFVPMEGDKSSKKVVRHIMKDYPPDASLHGLEETMLGSTVPLLKLTKFFQNANKAPYRKVNMPVGKNEQHPFFIL